MRIGINALYLLPGEVGGSEIYLRNLLRALAAVETDATFVVYVNRETDAAFVPSQPNFHLSRQPVRATSRPMRLLYEQFALPFVVLRDRLDALFNTGFTSPALCPVPMTTAIYDVRYRLHPEQFSAIERPIYRALVDLSAKRSARVLVLSRDTERELIRFFPRLRDRIALVPPGVEPSFRAGGPGHADTPDDEMPYVLAVSTLHPHKGLETLLDAFASFAARHPTMRLVIAGLEGLRSEQLRAQRHALELDGRIVFTGWIPREDLLGLYARARAFVFPSRFEGFGMPVLEALTAGLPTACSAIEPLREIVADAARTFAPGDVTALDDALEAVCFDDALRAELRAAGPRRAEAFSWDASARILLDAFAQSTRTKRR